MTIYLDCYTYPLDLLRAVGGDIPFRLYNELYSKIEDENLSKDELVEILKSNNVNIKEHYNERT